jgi:hypothetical protein
MNAKANISNSEFKFNDAYEKGGAIYLSEQSGNVG